MMILKERKNRIRLTYVDKISYLTWLDQESIWYYGNFYFLFNIYLVF